MYRISRPWTILIPLALLAGLVGAPGFGTEMEVAPFLAYRVGGLEIAPGLLCDDLPEACPERMETEDSFAWGLGFGVELREDWWAEIRFSAQSADLEIDGAASASSSDASWDRYIVSFERRSLDRSRGRWTPMFSLGGGWTDFSSEVLAAGTDSGLTHPTLEASIGYLMEHDDRLGIRVELRVSWTPLPTDLGGDAVQVGLGVSFRLKSRAK